MVDDNLRERLLLHEMYLVLSRDLKSLLTEIGFEDVEDGPLVFEEPEFKGSAALMRTSEFRPENRWVTSARKMTSND